MARRETARRGWRFARIAGIDVRVHPSFLLLVVLAAIGGFGPPLSGFAWLAAVFGSVIAHELAHSVVARHRRVPVRDILLLPIGGVSELEELPDHPRDELAVAIVGPLASFVLAAIVATLCRASGERLWPIDLAGGAFLARLAWINVLLGAFNLLPAFPLDGGRILRAALASRYGLERATRLAGTLGRVLAIVIGVVGLLADVWLVVIAAFVYFGSRAEELATIVHVRLAERRAGDVMLRTGSSPILPALAPVHVTVDDPLEVVVELLMASGAAAATVHDASGAVVGVIRSEDVGALLR